MFRTSQLLFLATVFVCGVSQNMLSFGQIVGIELHNNLMPASGGMGGRASVVLKICSPQLLATRPRCGNFRVPSFLLEGLGRMSIIR